MSNACARRVGLSALAALLAAIVTGPAAAAEETIRAFAAWQGSGRTLPTGPDEATFTGTIDGIVYVDTDKGPIELGRLACPAMVVINLADATQIGTAHCTITARDGARVFGELTCKGVYLVGCNGDFTLTGGTDRFAGITGGGKATVRSSSREFAATAATAGVQESATGIIFWPELKYTLPEPPAPATSTSP